MSISRTNWLFDGELSSALGFLLRWVYGSGWLDHSWDGWGYVQGVSGNVLSELSFCHQVGS